MTCKHMHKDAPENAICEDCFKIFIAEGALAYAHTMDDKVYKKMKGGQDDRTRKSD